uniref:Uncharacterized protein n=1 Tax=Tanacetum cinerariifolium TaxID=118510 RepID=A0A6L2L2X6_TANCI|nr:hypothetical protein [Tanacetum cinerariifolium]
MESLNPQMVDVAKLPILNPNEFDLWKIRIEQYFLRIDYSLWEDAKSLMEAIKKRFGGNKETKKVQKTLLKQLYENFNGTISESLNQIHDMLDNEDLIQINADDLEEINLKWQMAMLTMRARRFLQKTRRNLGVNGTAAIRFDMSKVKCYNFHKRCDFSRECRSPRDNRNKDTPRRTIPVEVSTSNALVSQCSSNYSRSNNEVAPCSKACSKAYPTLQTHYDKLTVDFRKSQFDVLSYKTESQVSDKTGLGYDSQVFNSQVFDYEEPDDSVPKSPVNDRYKSGEGYHVVLPPYTRTFMPPKPNLVFDDAPNASEIVTNVVNDKLSLNKPTEDMSKTLRPDAPIIKDWISDFEDETKNESVPKQIL